jgi:hypothetical protein
MHETEDIYEPTEYLSKTIYFSCPILTYNTNIQCSPHKNVPLTQQLKEAAAEVTEDSDEAPVTFDIPQLWNDLLAISSTDPKTTRFLTPLVFVIAQRGREPIQAVGLPAVDAVLAQFAARDGSLEARFAAASTLLAWLPALGSDYLPLLLEASVAYITDYIAAHSDFPKDFLDLYTEDGLDGLDDALANVVVDFIVAARDSPDARPAWDACAMARGDAG